LFDRESRREEIAPAFLWPQPKQNTYAGTTNEFREPRATASRKGPSRVRSKSSR